ncbi:PAS domain-containing protein [Shouchella sp. 1P01AA]
MIRLDASFFANSLDYTGIGIAITDPSLVDNPIIFINQGFTDITQYHLEEVMGKNCRFLQGENTNKEDLKKISESLQRSGSFKAEILNYKKDGTPFWNELTIDPAKNNKDDKTYFVGVQKDITKRKMTELAYLETIKGFDLLALPVVPLMNDIAIMSIVGTFTKARVNNQMANIKKSLADHHISTLAADVSSLHTFTQFTLENLLMLKEELNKIGTTLVLTGLSNRAIVAPLNEQIIHSSDLSIHSTTQILLSHYTKKHW